jgi:hypothetical protein
VSWNNHTGFACPCDPETVVRIKFRNGQEGRWEHRAGTLRWSHRDDAHDIVGFEIVVGAREAAE